MSVNEIALSDAVPPAGGAKLGAADSQVAISMEGTNAPPLVNVESRVISNRTSIVAGNLTEAVMSPDVELCFMAPGAKRVQGLQKWTRQEWVTVMQKHEELAMAFLIDGKAVLFDPKHQFDDQPEPTHKTVQMLLREISASKEAGATEKADDAWTNVAGLVRRRLAERMPPEVWEAVLHFQNECLYDEQKSGGKGSIGDVESGGDYLDHSLLTGFVFAREFPLGVEESLMRAPNSFALAHSGLGYHKVHHRKSNAVTCAIYIMIVAGIIFLIVYLILRMVSTPEHWSLDATIQDTTDPEYSSKVALRGRTRGRVASMLNAMTFSLFVNGSLDKFGLIDPSTSTVLVGMTLGGTWGFVLDNVFGSDEGFREYLWSPQRGMLYAMGCLLSPRFYRYIVTILFDMFFTVILFKHLYSRLVQVAGFSVKGREWIANAFVSAFISVLTFEVYANMTRFQWAYPSGTESVQEQWVSGPTMVLGVVIMNMVYLTSETRTRVGEPGINAPNTKLSITAFNFVLLWFLSAYDMIDPSNWGETNTASLATGANASLGWRNATNAYLPLKDVCYTMNNGLAGVVVFLAIAACCLGFVVFVTSAQSMSGLKHQFGCKGGQARARNGHLAMSRHNKPDEEPGQPPALKSHRASTIAEKQDDIRQDTRVGADHRCDRIQSKICLCVTFFVVTVLIVIVFTTLPFYWVDQFNSPPKWGPRNEYLDGVNWRVACDNYDVATLNALGLS